MVMEPPSPQSVGREFVRQFYTLLNREPLHLHRFYSHNSSFVRSGLDNGQGDKQDMEAVAVFGQLDIHQKIKQLNFRDCRAKIRQVDSYETLGNGVVVQVSGELSNNGEPMRRFMQTFVLAPQSPKKYYVHNDIFRYQDEVFSDQDEPAAPACSRPPQQQELERSPLKAQVIAQQRVELAVSPVRQVSPEPEAAMEPPLQLNGSNTSGGFEAASPAAEMEEPVEEWREPVESQQPDSTGAALEPVQVWAEAEAPAAEEAAPPSPEPGPRTWASMASKARPESKEAPAASQAPSRPPARGGPASGGRGAPVAASPRNDRFGKEDSKMGSDAQQIFVGNVPHECSEDHLAEVFGKYGKVIHVRINQKTGGREGPGARGGKQASFVSNIGFVAFDSAEAVERALADRPVFLEGGHRLNVEEKKQRVPRDGGGQYQDRRQDDHGSQVQLPSDW